MKIQRNNKEQKEKEARAQKGRKKEKIREYTSKKRNKEIWKNRQERGKMATQKARNMKVDKRYKADQEAQCQEVEMRLEKERKKNDNGRWTGAR